MKKSSLIKLVVLAVLVLIIIDGKSFGLKSFVNVSKKKEVKIEQVDSITYPNLLDEVTVIGKAPLK